MTLSNMRRMTSTCLVVQQAGVPSVDGVTRAIASSVSGNADRYKSGKQCCELKIHRLDTDVEKLKGVRRSITFRPYPPS